MVAEVVTVAVVNIFGDRILEAQLLKNITTIATGVAGGIVGLGKWGSYRSRLPI